MPAGARGGISIRIDDRALATLQAQMKSLPPKVRRDLRKGVRDASLPAVEELKAGAEGQGLHQDAAGTRSEFRVNSRDASVAVRVRSRYARPLEFGSGRGGSNVNRHPVFGRDVWVNQPTRPYFRQTIDAATPRMTAVLLRAVDQIARDAGFR